MMQPPIRTLFATIAALGLGACSSTTEAERATVDEFEVAKQPRLTNQELMTQADRALDEYAKVVFGPNDFQAEFQQRNIEKFIAQLENDYRDDFFSMARDGEKPGKQAVAVAVLGFSNEPAALPTILSALGSGKEPVVANAVFALSVLKHPDTPPAPLARLIEDESVRIEARASAAWTLHEVQTRAIDPAPFETIWRRLLERPRGSVDPSILVSAIRGMGRLREARNAPLLETFLDHPTPKLREAACIALERCGSQDSWARIVERIEPAETNPNVRLAAQKALQALAGIPGEQYDAKAWRKVFQRKRTDAR